jgi:hypothetical protein
LPPPNLLPEPAARTMAVDRAVTRS